MKLVFALILTLTCLGTIELRAAGAGRAVARGAARGAVRSFSKKAPSLLRRDWLRDRVTPAKPLSKPRTVFRYTTRAQAKQELKRGIAPRSHMTAQAAPGRPPSPAGAQQHFGLPEKPDVREKISLPKGLPTRHNRTLGGKPGVGELTSPRRISGDRIQNTVPLQ